MQLNNRNANETVDKQNLLYIVYNNVRPVNRLSFHRVNVPCLLGLLGINRPVIKVIKHLNPLGPHDALKHHFTALKTDLIFKQLGVLDQKFPLNWFATTW